MLFFYKGPVFTMFWAEVEAVLLKGVCVCELVGKDTQMRTHTHTRICVLPDII